MKVPCIVEVVTNEQMADMRRMVEDLRGAAAEFEKAAERAQSMSDRCMFAADEIRDRLDKLHRRHRGVDEAMAWHRQVSGIAAAMKKER